MQLGEWVLRTACATTLQFQRLQATPLAVCVNVSVVQLNAPTFVEDVLAIVKETGLAPETLILELTESMFVEDTAIVIAKLDALRNAGIRVAIDDFGTGYSSLSYLRRLPVDILKIAKPFVDDLAGGAEEDFTRAIVTIADALQLHVIAEGIEAASQVTRLLSLGCLAGQGYHLCHPLPCGGDRAAASTRRHRSESPRGRAPGEARAAPVDRIAMTIWLAVLAVLIVALASAGASWTLVRREKTRARIPPCHHAGAPRSP